MATPADKYIELNSLSIHYLDWGNPGAAPMLLLHAMASHAHSWDTFASTMAGSYHVVAMDLRGHGESQWDPREAYEVKDYASDVAALCEQLDLRDITVVGGSLGGRAAMVFAGTHPERVRRLVIEDVGPERPPEIAQRFARNVQEGPREFDSIEEVVALARANNPRASEEALRHNALHGTKKLPNGKLTWRRDPSTVKGFIPVDLWEFVGRIRCPTLIILGSESTIVSPQVAQRMLDTIAQSKLVTIEGAGHNVTLDRPDEFQAAVEAFLKG